MGALQLTKLHRSSQMKRICEEPDCNRSGRFLVSICGHPVMTESPIAHRPEQSQLCQTCGRKAKTLWSELTGQKRYEETGTALVALLGNRTERVDAIDALRELGYSKEEVLVAKARVGEGHPVKEILEGLLGGRRRVEGKRSS